MSSPSSTPVWLITGCSSGFGKALAFHARKSGHRVIATSRNPAKTPELVSEFESLGGIWHSLDLYSPESVLAEVVEKATSVYGRIDILVNCAAYALLGAFECISDKEARAQLETNLFGPMTLTRLVVPAMRARHSGTIVHISSTAGIEAKASRSLYSASKFALEGFCEALYNELKPLGVRVLLVEPGAFGSGFADACVLPEKGLPEEYRGTITGEMVEVVMNMRGGNMPGDVGKAVRAIFDVVTGTGQAEGKEEFLRLPLGKDNAARWKVVMEEKQRTLDALESIWNNTDVDK
ncbi:putative short chain oxidoreductase/dehydrogenase [Halenospora varia]|nr:putative short chain oxidoreductase/dehydrogenase [Halenospora varia]